MATAKIAITMTEEVRPPRDPSHGTADHMVWRKLRMELPEGTADWEQTDYGHPGRFNPWEARGIAAALQPKTARLRAIVDLIGAVAD